MTKALLITYEAKKISERAPGVGSITNIAIISERKVKMFSSDEIQVLDNVYKEKRKAELEWSREKEWEKELENLVDNIA